MKVGVKKFLVVILMGCFHFTSSQCQDVKINEVQSSNYELEDEEGDTPDWLELKNFSNETINLEGYHLTDNLEDPEKWTFPNIDLQAGEYLQIWASDKDIRNTGIPRTLITRGDEVKYLTPNVVNNPSWASLGLNDSSWPKGDTGIGYGDEDDQTVLASGTLNLLIRKSFTIADKAQVRDLVLHMDYDDAFVAYLNGVEVARANLGSGLPGIEAFPLTDREAEMYSGGDPDEFVIQNFQELLTDGINVLGIHVINVSNVSSDLTAIPFLTAVVNPALENIGVDPPSFLTVNPTLLHTNFKLSANGETVYLINPEGLLVDSLAFAGIPSGMSYGLLHESEEHSYFENPTPGAKNGDNQLVGAISSEVIFSHPGGLISNINLELSGSGIGESIRYTTDGSKPTITSQAYTQPISISANTVVRAGIFRNGYLPSRIISRSYLAEDHNMDVLSIIVDPVAFLDEEVGIYTRGFNASPDFPYFGSNFWEDSEIESAISLIGTNGSLKTEINAGLKIFGGWSRGFDQRSLSLFARKRYGDSKIEYPLFTERDYDTFEAVVLRNSGNDWLNTNVRDAILTSIMDGSGVDVQASNPVATYINGEYWGFYNMREKINEHYIASKHNVDPDDIDLLEIEGAVIHGNNKEYTDLIEFVQDNTLTNATNYEYVAGKIDIDNYIIYNVGQIYFDNTDWPGNNIKYWKTTDTKWKWIMFDTDFGFGIWDENNYNNNTLSFALNPNGPNWPNPPWSTLLLRRLMQNQTFRNKFVNTFADEMNTRFLPVRINQHISTIAGKSASEAARHYARWGGDVGNRNFKIVGMRTFAQQRPTRMKGHIRSTLNLPAYHRLTVTNDTPSRGSVTINDRVQISSNDWQGDYFQSVPFKVEAKPMEGYMFVRWEGDVESTESVLSINMEEAMKIVPIFAINTSTNDEGMPLGNFEIFPNPIASKTKVTFTLGEVSRLSLQLVDAMGSKVRHVFKGKFDEGTHTLNLDLENLSPGNYILILSDDDGHASQKKILKL